MQNVPQVEVLRAMELYLRQANLPQSPTIRCAIIPDLTREEIKGCTFVTIVPAVPDISPQSRNGILTNWVIDVAIQRAVQPATDASGQVRDLDWNSVSGMMSLQRVLILALHQFPKVLRVEALNSGPKEHAQQGVWTSVFRVTVYGETERW